MKIEEEENNDDEFSLLKGYGDDKSLFDEVILKIENENEEENEESEIEQQSCQCKKAGTELTPSENLITKAVLTMSMDVLIAIFAGKLSRD